jgi:Na+/H+ antiporter
MRIEDAHRLDNTRIVRTDSCRARCSAAQLARRRIMTSQTYALIFGMLVLIVAFAVAAKWLRLPYPIVFVIGGGLLAFIPGLPRVEVQPDLVFFLFLPPLLYAGGATTDWQDFKRYFPPIISLAVGLVAFTTVAVALVAHAVVGLPLPVAFVLGAIVSPPDAVAAEAIGRALPLPRAMKAILNGESLINDATALVIYRYAVAAVATGTFSAWQAGWQFVYVSIVGVAVGAVGVWLFAQLLMYLRRTNLADEMITVLLSLVTPFLVYLAAETVHASGVLAAVTAGILTSQKVGELFDHNARIAAYGVWSVLTFSLNGVLFILIGLQLRFILTELDAYPPRTLLTYGAAISLTVIIARFAWVYPITALRARILKLGSLDTTLLSRSGLFVVSWAGMRGIVTLATALALPIASRDGAPFPDRALLLFLAFCVIVVTLVGQGLTLPWFIRLMGTPRDDGGQLLRSARARMAQAGLTALESLEPTLVTPLHWEIAGQMRDIYQRNIALGSLQGATRDYGAGTIARELQTATIGAEREALAQLRRSGTIGDEVYRELQRDLDLEASRLGSV